MRQVLIRDLSKCIDCKACVSACESRHGRARMTMDGPRFGKYQLPDVCRNCPDTPCVSACHLGGMQLHSGKPFVSEACRGCNKCVQACRYGVIKLLPREHSERRGFFKNILAQARADGGPQPTYRVAADAARCVQCGICSRNCPVGIPVRDFARLGHTVVDPKCIGCGLCVAKCPRGTLRFETYPSIPASKFRADKCDLCRGYGESNCVKECPTGSLMRVRVDENLERTAPTLYAFLQVGAQESAAHASESVAPPEERQSTPVLTPAPAFLELPIGKK